MRGRTSLNKLNIHTSHVGKCSEFPVPRTAKLSERTLKWMNTTPTVNGNRSALIVLDVRLLIFSFITDDSFYASAIIRMDAQRRREPYLCVHRGSVGKGSLPRKQDKSTP